jgi:hypothetical protein
LENLCLTLLHYYAVAGDRVVRRTDDCAGYA